MSARDVLSAVIGGALVAAALLGCRGDRRRLPSPDKSAAPAKAACKARTAEKIGIPFVHVCPPGADGFWISAVPIGCSEGDHETVRCPKTMPLSHPVRADAGPLTAVYAAMVEKETAQRMCFMRMGGRLPSRAERSRARDVMGLATVMVTESESRADRFELTELPEWVVEEARAECETPGVAGPECVFGWFPFETRSPFVPWANLRVCEARFAERAPPGLALTEIGKGCSAPTWSWTADGGAGLRALPCAARSPARGPLGAPSEAVFTVACARPEATGHPADEDKDSAAYRCVVPPSALGTFDLPRR